MFRLLENTIAPYFNFSSQAIALFPLIVSLNCEQRTKFKIKYFDSGYFLPTLQTTDDLIIMNSTKCDRIIPPCLGVRGL